MPRKLSKIALSLSALGFWSGQDAIAQPFRPIDPLVRPRQGAGGYAVSTSLDYAPAVVYGEGGTFTRNELGLGLTGVYNVTDQLRVYGALRASGTLRQQLTPEGASGTQNVALSAPTLGAEYAFGGEYDPTLAADVTPPLFGQAWGAGLGLSASLLRDPLIVEGSLNYRYTAALPGEGTVTHDLYAGLGVGFVVNESFTLRGDVTQNWTVGRIVVPSTDVSTSVSYRLSEQSSLRAGASVNALGGETSWRTALGYTFRK